MKTPPGANPTRRDRLMALTALASYHIPGAQPPAPPTLIIAPARALMTRTLPRRDFLKATRIAAPGADDPDRMNWRAPACALGYEAGQHRDRPRAVRPPRRA